MTRTIVDVHLLQTVPPSNLNRDDTGSPKTATYGAVRRARVSSQAWKRATRKAFEEYLDASELGTRTKRVVELVADRIIRRMPEVDTATAEHAALNVLDAAFPPQNSKKKSIFAKNPRRSKDAPEEASALVFVSDLQVDALAAEAAATIAEGRAVHKSGAKALVQGKNSIDLALFGRMVADVTDLNVDAACQVAHALSTHAVETEYDYFTAVDDHKVADTEEDAGAGMIGTVEFNSATLYRYATIDVDLLAKNLGDAAATERAVSAFLQAFVRSMPTGKQNTFANRTLPDAVMISVREDQPVSYVGAFEEAVKETLDGGRVRRSAQKLADHAREVTAVYGGEPVKTWVAGVGAAGDALEPLGERAPFDDAVASVASLVAERLAADAAPASA